ncbi:hypothetical protein DWB77_01605 [Streptomyces hundungensis]|uniref:FHA domain-containing protein n=1 Tax=Streptomyces hundungensis TaxID=1077946 RepID=A0A387HEY4_9ACTN|nr:hypothetical protein [Streptomyces hundungensis]AYG79490.1 hypothetical protein DWB77_01605 [Streptomyces hundungensis]
MLIGSAEFYLNHRVVRIGATVPPEEDLVLAGAPLVASRSHIQLAARAQMGLVRIRLWNRAGPAGCSVLFEGDLMLDDGAIQVGDILGVSRFVQNIGAPGAHRIRVAVDDPGVASRVDVVIDSGCDGRALTSVNGLPLPQFVVAENVSLGRSDELALILSAHDMPHNRLAASFKVIKLAAESDPLDRVEILREFRMRMVCEWLRWLARVASVDVAFVMGSHVSTRLDAATMADLDRTSAALAAEVLERLAADR